MIHGQIQLTSSKSVVGPELDIVGFLQLEPSHSVLLKVCVVHGHPFTSCVIIDY